MTLGIVLSTAGILALGSIWSPFLKPESRAMEEGLRKYTAGEWVEAVERFQAATGEDPDPVFQFNLGAAAYQGQNYPEALRAYGAAALAPDIPPGRLAYDLGNALYRNEQLEDALKAYRQALRENPENEDARFNYEVTLRQLSAQEENPQQEQDQKQEGDQENEDSQKEQGQAPPDSSGQSSPQDPSPEEGEQQASQGEEPQDKEEEQQGAAAGEEQEQMLNPEEAKRLLNAVSPEEQELIRARMQAGKRRAVEKDW